MTKQELDMLFTLLEQFYPAAARKKGSLAKRAWELALRPYRYEDVKAVAVSHARKSRFFPDVSDLTADLVPQMLEPPAAGRKDRRWMAPYLDTGYVSPFHEIYDYAARHGVTVGQAMAALGVRSLGEVSA